MRQRSFLLSLLLVALSAFVVSRGVLPAWEHVGTDFPNYYTAARLVLEGERIGRFYDATWFAAQAQRYGLPAFTRFSPFPPATAFVMLPVAWLAPLDALRAWTVLNLALLVLAVAMLVRITGRPWRWNALLLMAAGAGLANNFRNGQFYVVLLVILLGGYRAMKTGRAAGGAAGLGLGIAVKYYPLAYLAIAATRKQWAIVATALLSAVLLTLACVPIWGDEGIPIAMVIDHLGGTINGQSPYAVAFQSWTPLLRRLFVFDPVENPSPPFASLAVFEICRASVPGFAMAVLAWTWRRTRTLADPLPLRAAMVGIVTLWALPLGATYHFVMLVLPVALLLAPESRWSAAQRAVLALHITIGFMPYAFFRAVEGKGWFTVFAFPRLWAITAMMIGAMMIVRERTRR